jgi:hypothetical protein
VPSFIRCRGGRRAALVDAVENGGPGVIFFSLVSVKSMSVTRSRSAPSGPCATRSRSTGVSLDPQARHRRPRGAFDDLARSQRSLRAYTHACMLAGIAENLRRLTSVRSWRALHEDQTLAFNRAAASSSGIGQTCWPILGRACRASRVATSSGKDAATLPAKRHRESAASVTRG